MAVLEHLGDCTGTWVCTPLSSHIFCPACERRYPRTPERAFAALFDAVLGDHMGELAVRGAALLAAERRR